jgi:hypothetical protein
MNNELISQAVAHRLEEVCGRASQLQPDRFGEMGEFVSAVRGMLLDFRAAEPKSFGAAAVAEHWLDADGGCLDSLRKFSLGEALPTRPVPHPPVEGFLQDLKQTAKQREPLFSLLVERYAYASNFSFPAENDVREYLLMRLMVADRARIEDASIANLDGNDLLLKLNLVAIHAAATTDLRFVDALNYYYELLPATWYPDVENGWLVASYLALYARALMFWL